jgi:hypothetical protein
MKIAIYGCSFAHEDSSALKENPGKAWAQILRKDYGWDITNFSQSGTGVYWSYSRFIETHMDFDRIIFLESSPDRLWAPQMSSHPTRHSSVNLAALADDIKSTVPKEYEILMNYWTYIHNPKEKEDMVKLMAKDIISIRPESLYIKSFDTLIEISYLDRFVLKNECDPRFCHMNNQNNIILASKINDWLSGNLFEFSIEDFKPMDDNEYAFYNEKFLK